MSSQSILANITSCQNTINDLEASIAALQRKLDDQEYALSVFMKKSEVFLSEVEDRVKRNNNVTAFQHTAVLSKRFQEKAEIIFSDNSLSDQNEAINSATASMKKEIFDNRENFSGLMFQLANERNRLSALQIDYQRACAEEAAEAERQRQAEANNK